MSVFSRRAMAFSVDSMTLRMLIFSGKEIESWYSVPLLAATVREGLVAQPEAVGSVMAEAIQENHLPSRAVVCTLPSAGSANQIINLPGVKRGNIKEMLRREIRRTMPGADGVDFVYWQPMPAEGGRQQFYALAVPRSNVQGLVDTCRAGGVSIRGIELKPFALFRAVTCKSGVIVHAELDNIEVVVVEKGFPGLFRSIPVKDSIGSVEIASQNMLRELPFTIDYYNRSTQDAQLDPEAPVYFSGELALDPNVSGEIEQATGREVLSPDAPVECPPNFPLAQFLPCVGLMLRQNW